jgi:hypothetical protein
VTEVEEMPAGVTKAHSIEILEDETLPAKNLQRPSGFAAADETLDMTSVRLIVLFASLRVN